MPSLSYTGRIGMFVVAGLVLWPTITAMPLVSSHGATAVAQERAITPTLLRRLAEAVDGHRTGTPVWVIAEYRFPNRVLAVRDGRPLATADSTELMAGRTDLEIGIFGPFRAPPDTVRDVEGFEPLPAPVRLQDLYFAGGCKHDRWTSVMRDRIGIPLSLPPTAAICPPEVLPRESIASITMTYTLVSGDTLTRPVPLWADALFFTVPALDKFVFPYYGRIVGMPEVARMRHQLLRDLVR